MGGDQTDRADEPRYVGYDEHLGSELPVLSDEEILAGMPPSMRKSWEKLLADADASKRRDRIRGLAAPKARRRSRPLGPGDDIGTSRTLAVRLPRWAEEQIRRRFENLSITPSEGLRQILEEWCVERMFPSLEHRDPEFVRFAAVRGGPAVLDWLRAGRPPFAEPGYGEALDYVELFRSRLEARLRAETGSP